MEPRAFGHARQVLTQLNYISSLDSVLYLLFFFFLKTGLNSVCSQDDIELLISPLYTVMAHKLGLQVCVTMACWIQSSLAALCPRPGKMVKDNEVELFHS